VKQKFSDKDVVTLLSNLKNAEQSYPSEMIQSRRDMYMKQAATMAILMKTSGGGTPTGEGGASASGTGTGTGLFSLGTFFETALVITIMVEAGVAAYIYRDQIADFINSTLFPTVEVAANPTDDPSFTPAVIPVTGDELATESPTITVTVTVTVTDTPFPILVTESFAPDVQEDTNSDNLQVESTPPPVDNPGNHYGNTPKPERTKDAGNNPPDGQDTNKEDKGNKK
jgi:hypothetical protein